MDVEEECWRDNINVHTVEREKERVKAKKRRSWSIVRYLESRYYPLCDSMLLCYPVLYYTILYYTAFHRLYYVYCILGFAVHHGGLLPILKEAVELLFSRSIVKVWRRYIVYFYYFSAYSYLPFSCRILFYIILFCFILFYLI